MRPKNSQTTAAPRRYRYNAFLSYAHEDKATVQWLHRLLAGYWIPGRRRRSIFMDQESLPAYGGLTSRLKDALRDARFLIVCCSRNAVESPWVQLEVQEFLKTHSADAVLACFVGSAVDEPSHIPNIVSEVERRLGDRLYKPDLTGNPEKVRGAAVRVKVKEALSLLAPLVDLPGKDVLLDRRKKTIVLALVAVLSASVSGVGWELWRNRPQAQIDRIIASSVAIVRGAAIDTGQLVSIQPWLQTMVRSGRHAEALSAARSIGQADLQARALTMALEELAAVGQRHTATLVADEAFRVGQTIANAGMQRQTLAKLADSLTKIDLVDQALLVAKSIDDPDERARALVNVVGALARARRTPAARHAALETIEQLQRSEFPATNAVSYAIAILAFGSSGLHDEVSILASRARSVLDSIEYPVDRSRTRAFVIEALAEAGRPAEALKLSRRISDPAERCASLMPIVRALVAQGDSVKARQVVVELMPALARLADPDERADAATQLIAGLSSAGFVGEAIQAAQNIRQPKARSRAMSQIVGASIARKDIPTALRVALLVDDAYERSWALVHVLEGAAGEGTTRSAADALLASAPAIESKSDRAQLLARAVPPMKKAGLHEAAHSAVILCFAAARDLHVGHDRVLSLIQAVETAADANLDVDTRQFAAVAFEAVRSVPWSDSRMGALKRLLSAMGRAALLTEALETANALEDAYERAQAQALMASVLAARPGFADQAGRVIDHAEASARQVTSASGKSAVAAEIAAALAGQRKFRRAREIIATNAVSSNDTLRAYTAIVGQYCGAPCSKPPDRRPVSAGITAR